MCNLAGIVSKKVKRKVKEIKYVKVRKMMTVTEAKTVFVSKLVDAQVIEKISEKKPLTGYRFMNLLSSGKLVPLNNNRMCWNRAVAVADKVPTDANSNGLYIFSSLDEALHQSKLGKNTVLCKVKFWGTCAKHKHGYRAEKAKIVKIFTLNKDHELITAYGQFDSIKSVYVGRVTTPLKNLIAKNAPALKKVPIEQFSKDAALKA